MSSCWDFLTRPNGSIETIKMIFGNCCVWRQNISRTDDKIRPKIEAWLPWDTYVQECVQ